MLRRFSVFSLALLLCLSLFPACALAWDVMPKGVLYQGDVEGSNYGAVVSAYNQFDAACYVLGKDPNTISASIKEKLSDPNYGGKFYEYSQYFFTQSGSLEDVPAWVPTYIVMIGELGDLVLSDYQSVWYASTTKALHDAALVDFKHVLYGEEVEGGGGGSTVVPGTYELVSFQSFNWRNTSGATQNTKFKSVAREATYHDGEVTLGSGTMTFSPWGSSTYYVSGCRGYVSSSVLEVVSSYVSQGYDVVFCLHGDGYDGSNFQSYVGFVYFGHDLSFSEISTDGKDRVTALNGTDMGRIRFSNTGMYYDSLGIFMFVSGSAGSVEQFSGYQYLPFFSSPIYGVTNPPPSGTWPEPETPVTPTAPDLPEPVEPTVTPEPTVTTPTPTWPDVNITVNPPAVVVPETPDGLDYTELLTLINDNLNSINSYTVAINSSLNSLRGDLVTEFDSVVQALRNIYGYLEHMDSVLEVHCVHIRNKLEDVSVDIQNKMRELVRWLADQLDFDATYNSETPDNSLLTTINEKLGGGTYEPNPIKDEQGYYEWLDDLWDRFLLGDNWQNSMGSISGSFSELKTRFPFSVPWDIVALFRLFVHDPVTPVFDLPLYFSADGSTPVHVDLSPWDSVASLVRPMIFVIFALKLALLSRDLLGGLGADKGGL